MHFAKDNPGEMSGNIPLNLMRSDIFCKNLDSVQHKSDHKFVSCMVIVSETSSQQGHTLKSSLQDFTFFKFAKIVTLTAV